MNRPWVPATLDDRTLRLLSTELSGSQLHSVLLEVMRARRLRARYVFRARARTGEGSEQGCS